MFNIQHYSLHDGTGIRTIVFLKGCPLTCRWCCNPESQAFAPEVSLVANKCLGRAQCGWCARACSRAVSFGKVPGAVADDACVVDRGVVARLSSAERSALVEACPAWALKVEGRWMDVGEVLAEVRRDAAFYRRGGGGLTVSGGEPLAHQPFLSELLAAARRERLRCAIETCGMAPYENLASAAEHLDEIMFDVKCIDADRHRMWTGRDNVQILGNLRRLCQDFPELPKLVRTPIVPGFNDSEDEVAGILAFLRELGGVRAHIRYQPLPYHEFGRSKYTALGRDYPMGDARLDGDVFGRIERLVRESELSWE